MEVKFYESIADEKLKYAVIIAKYQHQYVWVRHSSRITWEIPGGKREDGETILTCAKRELYEESGAISFTIEPLTVYNVISDTCKESFGMLFFAEIQELGPLPQSEIAEVILTSTIPQELTYPNIQPHLIKYYYDFKHD